MLGDWSDDLGSHWFDDWAEAEAPLADAWEAPVAATDTTDPLAYWHMAGTYALQG